MTGYDWTAAAMSDGALVAELLVHLKNEARFYPPLRWHVRQRRSKTTESPNTPLSWKGCGAEGSTSVAAERYKTLLESNCPSNRLDNPYRILSGFEFLNLYANYMLKSSTQTAYLTQKLRELFFGPQGVDVSENMTSKRSRKKKTLAELKEDEVLGLKEKSDLEKKLASLHVTVEIERARNDRLKRLKIDCVSRFTKRVSLPVPAEESSEMVPSISPFSADLRINSSNSVERLGLSDPAKPNEEAAYQENKFMLPDLNLPIEDHNT